MPAPTRLVYVGHYRTLLQITAFCRAVYHRSFGPEEGEARYRKLRFTDAVELWRSGLPDSALVH